MTWNDNGSLVNAILSMDAYNRGYNAGIKLHEPDETENQQLGDITILSQSNVASTSDAFKAGFYALSYDLGGGQTIISYRGTDQAPEVSNAIGLADLAALFIHPSFVLGDITVRLANNVESILTPDVWNGWFIAAGVEESAQALLAFEFYKDVVGGVENIYSSNISLTGHSLGGGLAGLVGGAYGVNATMFDQMPFENALLDTWNHSKDPNSSDYDNALKETVYGDGTVNSPSYSAVSHKSFSIDGEALASIRNNTIFGINTTSTIQENPYNLGSTLLPEQLTGGQRHSQSLLAMRLFFSNEDGIGEGAWDSAATYFWPVLFNDSFAHKIGFNNINEDVIGGASFEKGEFSDILRTTLAYSVIDEDTLIFGDTGIRALYNDANELGSALTAATSTNIELFATDISQALVQFAGTLALNKIEKENFTKAVDGVVKHHDVTDNQSLTIDFTDTLWEQAGAGTVPPMIARAELINKIITVNSEFYGYMQDLWGDRSVNVFDNVVFALNDTGITNYANTSTSESVNLFIGGAGAQTVFGAQSSANFIIGSNVVDALTGGNESDILIGGAGNDALTGRSSSILNHRDNDYLFGGEGNDTLARGIADYSLDPEGVAVSVIIDSNGDGSVVDGWGDTDTLTDIAGAVLTDGNDTVVSQGASDLYKINGGDGVDTLTVSGQHEVLLLDGNNISIGDGYGNLGAEYTNFEVINFNNWWSETLGDMRILVGSDNNQVNSLLSGATNNIIALDYSMIDGAMTFDYSSTSLNVSGNNIVTPHLYDNGYLSSISGNHSGNTYNVNELDNDIDIYTGVGNDVVNILDATPANEVNAHYFGGDDVFNTTVGLGSIQLGYDISINDVTLLSLTNGVGNIFDAVFNVDGYGSITIHYDSLAKDGNIWNINEHVRIDAEDGFFDLNNNLVGNDLFWSAPRTTFIDTHHADGTWGNDNFTGNGLLRGFGGDDVLYGSTGQDNIYGGIGNDVIYGHGGVDQIRGGRGNDVIFFGGETQTLLGGLGEDRFVIDASAYADNDSVTILDFVIGEDVLDFDQVVGANSLSDLIITPYGSTNTQIQFDGSKYVVLRDVILSTDDLAEAISLAPFTFSYTLPLVPTTVQSVEDDPDYINTAFPFLQANDPNGEVLQGSFGFDDLSGASGNDYLYGGDGFDVLYGDDGNDVLDGGDSADTLNGGAGDDFYIISGFGFNGDFYDSITDFSGTDTLILTDGIVTADLELSQSGNDLIIKDLNGSWLGVEIADQFSGGENGVEYIEVEGIIYDLHDVFSTGVFTPLTASVAGAPRAFDDVIVVEHDAVTTGSVFANNGNGVDYDPDGIYLEVNPITITDTFGSFILDANGNYTVTTNVGVAHSQVFSYTLRDADGNEVQANIDLTVQISNYAPVAGVMDAFFGVETGGAVSFVSNFTDADGDTLSYWATLDDGSPLPDGLVINPTTGEITGTAPDIPEDYAIRISASDGTAIATHDVVLTAHLNGTSGDDRLHGTENGNVISGDAGNDIIHGYEGIDFLNGEVGNDVLYGGDGNDEISGDAGNDALVGGAGNDYLDGGAGVDEFIFNAGFDDDEIDSFEVGEKLNFASFSTVTDISDLTITASGSDSLITLSGEGSILVYGKDAASWTNSDFVFGMTGTTAGEALIGADTWDHINGLDGLDYLTGNGGNDVILGGDGEDRLYGNDGDDVLHGGNDNDRIYGHEGNDMIYGDSGWDLLYGLQGDDTIYGGIGNDIIRGDDDSGLDSYVGAGNDELHGGDGGDSLSGGAGDDTLYGDSGNDTLYGNAGIDTLYGGTDNDYLYGGNDNDTLNGGDGNDQLRGEEGNDTIYGDNGSDSIYGGNGDDTIIGGNGRDYLNGDAGADTFYLDLEDVDRVRDFDQGEGDKINIADLLDGYDSATDDINNFVDIVIRSTGRTDIRVNEDGVGNDLQYVGIVYGDLTGETVDNLVTNGTLIVE